MHKLRNQSLRKTRTVGRTNKTSCCHHGWDCCSWPTWTGEPWVLTVLVILAFIASILVSERPFKSWVLSNQPFPSVVQFQFVFKLCFWCFHLFLKQFWIINVIKKILSWDHFFFLFSIYLIHIWHQGCNIGTKHAVLAQGGYGNTFSLASFQERWLLGRRSLCLSFTDLLIWGFSPR